MAPPDRAREQGHPFVLRGRPGELRHPETPEVGGLDQLGRDAVTVERGVGGPVGRTAVVADDADETRVLHAVGL